MRAYVEGRGWTIVLEQVDDGVRATYSRPEDRLGWRGILESDEPYGAVLVWKVDRLARRVVDFLNAQAALQSRGAGLVCRGRPRRHDSSGGSGACHHAGGLRGDGSGGHVGASHRGQGRLAGGRPPFGWMNVRNPNGPGMVLAKDPERIGHVIKAVSMVMAGETLFAVARHFEQEGIQPRTRARRRTDHRLWVRESIDDILRNPTLCGMTPYQPGRRPGPWIRDVDAVLRDSDGMPVINESVAIMEPAEWRALTAKLDARLRPGTRPRHADVVHPLLYNLLRCMSCGKALYKHQFPQRVQTSPRLRLEPAEVPLARAWARRHGFDVKDRGHLTQEVIAAYRGLSPPAYSTEKFEYYGCTNRVCPQRVSVGLRAIEDHVMDEFLKARGNDALSAEDDITARRLRLTGAIDGMWIAPAQRRGGRHLDAGRARIEWRCPTATPPE
jgi:hypothetical protein